MHRFIDRNNTSFPLSVYEYIKSRQWDPKKSRLLYNQFVVNEYLMWRPKQRGLALFHGMGVGKTWESVFAANAAIRASMYRKVIVIGPKSIHDQFATDFDRLKFDGKVQYVSLKASNMSEQVEHLDEVPGIDVGATGSLDGAFIIIDEAHGFFSSIANGSRNAVDLYDMIMEAKDVKILFLTGSPITNDPFELVPCYNMLAGFRLFPENKDEFDKFFIDDGNMKNRDKFMNRIMGLTSYYGELVQPDEIIARFPPITEHIVKIPMSEKQFAIYSGYRDIERDEANRPKPRSAGGERFSKSKSSSSYRVRSRMASNMVPITGAIESEITDPANCPKAQYILRELLPKHAGQKGILLSGFVNNCGLADFGRLLEANGWERWESGMDLSKTQRYSVISGDTNEMDRAEIRRTYNKVENLHGGIIRLLLLGPAATEGISLLGARFGTQYDPYFNAIRGEQGPNRIRRIDSNRDWPEGSRDIQFYVLLADYPTTYKPPTDQKTLEPTTDIYLHERARKNRKLHKQFFQCMIESSIDCLVHRDGLTPIRAANLHCKMCSPDNVPLWSKKLDEDMSSDDPCKPPKVESIKAEEMIVEVEGKQYKYMHSGDTFYEFKRDINGYVPMARNHPHYNLLISATA